MELKVCIRWRVRARLAGGNWEVSWFFRTILCLQQKIGINAIKHLLPRCLLPLRRRKLNFGTLLRIYQVCTSLVWQNEFVDHYFMKLNHFYVTATQQERSDATQWPKILSPKACLQPMAFKNVRANPTWSVSKHMSRGLTPFDNLHRLFFLTVFRRALFNRNPVFGGLSALRPKESLVNTVSDFSKCGLLLWFGNGFELWR